MLSYSMWRLTVHPGLWSVLSAFVPACAGVPADAGCDLLPDLRHQPETTARDHASTGDRHAAMAIRRFEER